MSLTSVTVLEGLQGTINLQDYSLASIQFLPQHQRKQYPFRDIIQSDGNPSTSTGYGIVMHRSPFQIIQPIIQFECLSSGSSRCVYASRHIRWSIAYYGQLSMWHLGYSSDSTRRLPADPQRLRIPLDMNRTLLSILSATVSMYSRCTLSVYSVLQWIRRPAYIGPRPPSAPSKLSTSISYASAYVSAKTFHDAVPAGSIGKFHHTSKTYLCCYVITRL